MDRKSISLEWAAAAGTVLLVAAVMVLDSHQAKKEAQPAVQVQASAMHHEPVAMADAAARLALEQVQQPVKP